VGAVLMPNFNDVYKN